MGRTSRGGRPGGGGRRGRKSLNAKFDHLIRSNIPRSLELLAPNRSRNVIDRGRQAERKALLERFGVGEEVGPVLSSINLPHLPSFQALANVKPRLHTRTLRGRTAPLHKTAVGVHDPEQWLIDIMYPEHAQRRSPSLAPSVAMSPARSGVVSPFEEMELAHEGGHVPKAANPKQEMEMPQSAPGVIPIPTQPIRQGPAGYPFPWANPINAAQASTAGSSFVPLWLTPHGVVDVSGNPVFLPTAAPSPHNLHQRHPHFYSSASHPSSRYSLLRKRRRRRFPSYSPDTVSDLESSERRGYARFTRQPRRLHHKQRLPAPKWYDGQDEESVTEALRCRHGFSETSSMDESTDRRDDSLHYDIQDRQVCVDAADDRSRELGLASAPGRNGSRNATPSPSPSPSPSRHGHLGARAHHPRPKHGPAQPGSAHGPGTDALPISQPPLQQCPTKLSRQSIQPALAAPPTPPGIPGPLSPISGQDKHVGLGNSRVAQKSEHAPDSMNGNKNENSPNCKSVAYPPTPATTATSSDPRPPGSLPSNWSENASSEGSGKSPSKMQRMTERAWAALAAMQPHHEEHEPVTEGTPAPPSPTLAPVDAQLSDDEEMVDVEDESILQFSEEDERFEPDVPQFNLSWDEVEDVNDSERAGEPAPPAQSHDKSSTASVPKSISKRVRFAWDIGATGESDPGFKIWRDRH